MIKTTLGAIVDADQALTKVLKSNLEWSAALSLRHVHRAILAQGRHYRDEMSTLVEKYGERDDKGKVISVDKGNGVIAYSIPDVRSYEADVKKLRALTVELLCDPIDMSILVGGGIKISAEDADFLEPFLNID